MSAPHIFISYKREDAVVASQVRLALQAVGIRVWWDADLQTGGQWAEEIDTALQSAYAVVVLWSKAATQSDWVKHEASVAKSEPRQLLAPYNHDHVTVIRNYPRWRLHQLVDRSFLTRV